MSSTSPLSTDPLLASSLSADAQNVNWLLSSFVTKTRGVQGAIGDASDGLLVALSANMDGSTAERFSAYV